MNSVPNQKLNLDQSLSFEDVSKLFPLPLSEAADILGVSTSVLKKLCNDNGLERWPHRKYLAGKSIEEINKEAAKEKNQALGRSISQTDKQKNTAGSHDKDKISKTAPEICKAPGNQQHPGSKTTYTWRPHQIPGSGFASETKASSDEFKYGFPSYGLSISTNRWWGTGCEGRGAARSDKADSDVKDGLEAQVQDSSGTLCEKITDSLVERSDSDEHDKVSLSSVRKRALDEGRQALKSGCLKKYGADKLEKEEKVLLRRLFQTS